MRFCKKKVTVVQEHEKLSKSLQVSFFKEKVNHFTYLLKTQEHTHKQMNEHAKIGMNALLVNAEGWFEKEQMYLSFPFLFWEAISTKSR